MSKYSFTFTDSKIFKLVNVKHPQDEFAVDIDISDWLGEDTISTVVFTASGDVLDAAKNTYTNTMIKPYLQSGVDGLDYMISMQATTAAGDVGTFYLRFMCRDLA